MRMHHYDFNVVCLQDGLRNADFSTTLTVFGLKPRSGKTQVQCVRIGQNFSLIHSKMN